jgi:arginase
MQVHVIGVPCVEATSDSSGRTVGLAEASDAFLAAGLLDRIGELGIAVRGTSRPQLPADKISGDPICNLGRYNDMIGKSVTEAITAGLRPVLAGGTCSHLIGMLAGLQNAYEPRDRIGLVWLDAHGDFNTPVISPSGMLGGMPVATAAGLCHAHWRERAGMTAAIPTNRIVMIDVRNLDPKEAELITATDVSVAKFGSQGETGAIATAIQRLADRVDHLYLHVDADVLDASLQPNHPTAEPDGPGLDPVLAALRIAFATEKVRAFGVVSVNPTGPDGPVSLASGMRMILDGLDYWNELDS